MIMHCIPLTISLCFMHLDVCLFVENCVLLGLNWVEPMMQFLLACHMFMHISCIRTLSFLFIWFGLWLGSYLSLSRIDSIWHLSAILLRSKILFVPNHLLLLIFPLLTFGSMMRRLIRTSRRTFLNVVFIRSTMWFYWTFSILLYSLSFTLRDGNLFVRYPWGVLLWSYKSFTLICTVSIPLYLSLLRISKVHVS